MRYTFFAASTILYSIFLGPAFYYLWIYAGSGNANFFYAITLVWSLGQSLLVSDFTFAVLRDEWEVERQKWSERRSDKYKAHPSIWPTEEPTRVRYYHNELNSSDDYETQNSI